MRLQVYPFLRLRRLALAVALILSSASAPAMTGDTVEPFAYFRLTMDDNLFRSASNEQTDRYQQLGAGLLLDWKQSRQEVTGKIDANKTTFSKHGLLDFSGYDMLGQWNWQAGNHASGQLGYSKTRSLGSFQDVNVGLTQNTVDEEKTFFNASYLLHPSWRVNGIADRDAVNYSAAALTPSNRTVDHLELSTEYLTPKGSRVGVFADAWRGDYPNRQVQFIPPFFVLQVDNSYKQAEFGVRTFLVLDGKLQLNGQIGQTRRTHKDIPQRDFSGLTGRLDTNWQATGKLQVAGSIYRAIGAVDDIYASYALTDGIRLTPSLQITPRVQLSAEAYYENQDFQGDPFFIGQRRRDIVKGASLSLSYQLDTWALMSLSYQAGNRATNNHVISNDFNFQTLSLLVVLQF